MDEYADFVEKSLRHINQEHASMQKSIEERVLVPFRFGPDDGGESRDTRQSDDNTNRKS